MSLSRSIPFAFSLLALTTLVSSLSTRSGLFAMADTTAQTENAAANTASPASEDRQATSDSPQPEPASKASSPTVFPTRIQLDGRWSQQRIVVLEEHAESTEDWSRKARYTSGDESVAVVDETGVVLPRGSGQTEITVSAGSFRTTIPVNVTRFESDIPVDFEQDVEPILSKFGCNSGPCHGKARGQNGFQLSLLGFDAGFDYESLTREGRGRRVFLSAPDESLLLRKPAGLVPHGGGKRIDPQSASFDVLRSWIVSGAPRRQPGAAQISRLTVFPEEARLKYEDEQQLVVTAHFDDGTTRDVTHLCAYQSSDSTLAEVSESGLVTAGKFTGEPAVMARYEGQIAISRMPIPRPVELPEDAFAAFPQDSYIDQLIVAKLKRLRIPPSPTADDQRFMRRVYLDIIGRMPTADEARTFLEDKSANRREKLVDALLDRPEYGDHWANKWADLLRPNPYRVGIKAVLNYDAWIRDSFRRNQPYNEFVSDLLTAQGSTFRNGAVTLFRDRRSPDELANMVSQLFLGIRLECAKCHHHPFEVWGQDDFYSFAAYFAQVGRKGTGLSPPISGSEEFIFDKGSGSVSHPVTGETLPPRPLFGEIPADAADGSPRQQLAAWITNPANPFFAQVMANRVWADLMGRGLVDPVDDLRATNPPTNADLLTALGEDFRDSGFDLKQLIRRITLSTAYRLDTRPVEGNESDRLFHSRYYRQRLRAEVLLDSIAQITGVPESFSAMPPGSSAKQIWTHRVSSVFLDTFGRPDPNQDPPCERSAESTVVQTIHLMNSPELYRKVTSDAGLCGRLSKEEIPDEKVIEELYLSAYSRFPTAEEHQVAAAHLKHTELTRKAAIEDLLWALMNTPEFVYKD